MTLFKKIGPALLLIAFAVTSALAGEYSHFMPGMPNIRDFFVPDKTGVYYQQYNFYYSSKDFRDSDGDTLDSFSASRTSSGKLTSSRDINFPGGTIRAEAELTGTGSVSVDSDIDVKYKLAGIVPAFMIVTDWKILGATYAAYVTVPFVYTRLEVELDGQVSASLNVDGFIRLTAPDGKFVQKDISGLFSGSRSFSAEVDEDQFNLGDIFVQPVWLGWSGKNYSASLGYGIYAPTGDFEQGALDNTGLGFWEHQIQAAGVWYPWEHRATAVTLAATYEINHKKKDVDITPGSVFSLNFGVSQFLPLKKDNSLLAELGVTGYSQWQVTDDSGDDASNEDVHDQVHSAGCQAGLIYAPWNAGLSARFMHEFYAEDHFRGNMFMITIGKKL
jgi:hypothetical protein